MYGKHRKIALYTGSETECREYIMSLASDHIKYTKPDGTEVMLVRELAFPDGTVYDVGQSVMYQIVDAADGEIGIDNPCWADGNK